MNLVERVKNILVTPKTEWPVIAAEKTTVADLYQGYIAILAAIPAVAGFIGSILIGFSIVGGLIQAVLTYVLSLALTYVMALIIDALATTFDGQKNQVQALKTAAYTYTASWVAGIALIVPIIGGLIALLGSIYGIYLLYLGLPATMKCPSDKAVGYTAVTIICGIVLGWIVAAIAAFVVASMVLMSMR